MSKVENDTTNIPIVTSDALKSDDSLHVQAKLDGERDKIQLITNSINGILWEVNAQTFQTTYVSSQAENILGYSSTEWLSEKDFWVNHLHPEDREKTVNYIQQTVSELKDYHLEYRMIAKDGREVWLEDKVSVISEGDKAMILRGIAIDITEKKLVESQLVDSQLMNRLFLENSGEGIIMSDQKGAVYSANHMACQIFGRTEEEMQTVSRSDLIDTADPRLGDFIRESEENGAFRGELIGIHKDGTKIQLYVSSQYFEGINGQPRISLTISDISERIFNDRKEQSKTKVLDLISKGVPLERALEAIVLDTEANDDKMLCSILLMDKDEKHLVLGVAPSLPKYFRKSINGLEIGPAVGACGSAAYLGEVVIIDNVQTHPNWKDKAMAKRVGIKSSWSQPIKDGFGSVLGVLSIYHKKIKIPSPADLNLIKEYASLATIAIERSIVIASLQNSNRKLERLYNSTPTMLHTVDAARKLISVSDYWLSKMEYTREEVLGQDSMNFLTADSREYAKKEVLPKFLNDGIINNIEFQFVTKSGRILDTLLSAVTEEDDKGAMVKSMAVITDISERRKTEQKLADSENQLRTILESEPECVKLLGPSGELEYMNPAGLAMLEADSLDQLIGGTVLHIIAPEYREAFAKIGHEVFKGNAGKLEFEVIGLKGTPRWLETYAVPLKNAEGNITSLLGVTRDVTKHKNDERALLESEQKFRSAINNMAEGVLIEDSDRKINVVNDRFIELFKVPVDKGLLIGMDRIASVALKKEVYVNADKYMARMNELVQYRELTLREEINLADGRVFERDYIPVEGGQGSQMWVYRDVTEKKKLEYRLRKKAQQLSSAAKLANFGEWEMDLIDTTVRWSDEVCLIHGVESGYTPILETAIDFYTEESKPIISQAVDRCIDTGESFDVTLQIITQSAEKKWVRSIGLSERVDNKTIKVYGIFQNIDEAKTKELELEKLAIIAKNTDNLVVVTDANRKIQWVNQAFIDTTGYELEEVKGQSPAHILRGEDTDSAVLAEVREKLNRNEGANFEIVNYSKSGKKYWLDIGIQPVFDHKGDLDYFIAIETDITERKLKDELIKKSESNLRSIFENADTAYILLDHNCEIQSFNTLAKVFAQDIMHSKLEEGIYGLDVIPASRRAQIAEYFNDALKGNASHYEINYGEEETERWFSGRFFPVNVDTDTTGVIMAVTEVTREKLGERLLTNNYKELLLINEEKETLLKEIHHRVKNNLQLISSIIYIRMTGMPNSLTKSFLSETRQKINSIALIHETLLQQTESTKEVDIDNYLSKLMSDMQVAYASDHAAVNLSIDIDPIMVSIDVAINCSMIVTELFANSIKHADKAHITECNIGLSLHKKSHGIEFVMSDNGPGIPDDIRPGKHNSFGMKLLDVFFKQLEAEVIIEGTKGTVYRLLFKL